MSHYELNGEHYRDDRMFVLYLCKCTEKIQIEHISTTIYHKNPPQDAKWCLVTYRNVERYIAVRADTFETKQEAEQYIKSIEPTVPLVSLGGILGTRPLSITTLQSGKVTRVLRNMTINPCICLVMRTPGNCYCAKNKLRFCITNHSNRRGKTGRRDTAVAAGYALLNSGVLYLSTKGIG